MSEFYDFIKDGFTESLAQFGLPIVFNGITKTCVIDGIEQKRAQDLAGFLPEAATRVDILDNDFAAFTAAGIGDRSIVTINGIDFRIIAIDFEPQNPTVHLIVTKSK